MLHTLPGFTASTISFPLEVARKRLMVGALEGKCPPHMAAALSEVIREGGLRGLYRGWGASCLKVMPSSGITWMFYEAWKDILVAGNGHLWQTSTIITHYLNYKVKSIIRMLESVGGFAFLMLGKLWFWARASPCCPQHCWLPTKILVIFNFVTLKVKKLNALIFFLNVSIIECLS